MRDFQDSADLSERVFNDFKQGRVLAERIASVEDEMQSLQRTILSNVFVESALEPDFFVPQPAYGEQIRTKALYYFQNLAVKNEVNLSLSSLTSSLSQAVVGQAVVVKPVDPNARIIKETYFSSGLTGSRRQEPSGRNPFKAIGTIDTVVPSRNLLRIIPIRGTNASMNKGYYTVPVIGEDNEPLVTIELREKGLRDKPSRIGGVLHRILDPVLAIRGY